ncbi:MAG TPA: zinc-dependent metalloprotease [Acidimicrobiales bacterium]|nr:zinc-dependent metalloprotease [Acidimicrobiales bacterium]
MSAETILPETSNHKEVAADQVEMISWSTARKVAAGIAARSSLDSVQFEQLRSDFNELVPIAERLVLQHTGLEPPTVPANPAVVGRAEWVLANTNSFEKLLNPFFSKLNEGRGQLAIPGGGPFARLGRTLTGTEVGALLGWMSSRVLGQYDVIFGALEERDQDGAESGDVLFVGPNIVEVERRNGFPPRQFRLWIALHELTHRAQFTGVPWMRSYFMSLVEDAVSTSMPESGQIFEAAKRAMSTLGSKGKSSFSEAGVLGLFMDEPQRAVFSKVQGLMSLLEGHGDIVMDKAGADLIPLAPHFSRVLAERRKKSSGVAKLIMQAVGLDAKLRQYAEGERFIHFVHEAGGKELFDLVWQGPERLPDSSEIADPAKWVERMKQSA